MGPGLHDAPCQGHIESSSRERTGEVAVSPRADEPIEQVLEALSMDQKARQGPLYRPLLHPGSSPG